MTTKPRAFKFRVGQAALSARGKAQEQPPAAPSAETPAGTEDGFGDRVFPTAAAAQRPEQRESEDEAPTAPGAQPEGEAAAGEAPEVGPAADGASTDADVERELAAIKAEGLSGRQLRMARRVAEKHGISAESDLDAVRLLRKRGIDPFRHANMLELVIGASGRDEKPRLPQKLDEDAPKPPTPAVFDDNSRAQEILRVQREIAWRRKKRFALMVTRLAAFVLLPTILAGYYFDDLATPMYGTKSEFVIQQAQPQGMAGSSSLFSSSPLATAQDSMTVQSYLQSREAMLRLEIELGFKAHYSDPTIDPIQRLAAGASNEEAYRTYTHNVKIGYDPTEGIIKMEVIAPDPELSAAFSRALISYAEEQVDQLTQRLREDQMSGARETYEEAEAKVLAAQQMVIELQERRGIISADAEIGILMSQISGFETELQRERLALQQFLENPNPNITRVSATRGNIARLEGVIIELRAQLTESTGGSDSLARITGELMIAEGELSTRQVLLAQSLEQMETARIEANRQVRYLSTGVSPVAPDEPTYPRVFENTLVTFLILSGIYLMISITVSILREQVSA
ncbi:MAG: capsule biosynthesis protein [Paracoccaceae bacterium]|nr:capsule biosynthesis protein [Paracoccaceae bacterium]